METDYMPDVYASLNVNVVHNIDVLKAVKNIWTLYNLTKGTFS